MSRILIIEDESAIAELEKDYLELSGFEVEVANDGEIGLNKALSDWCRCHHLEKKRVCGQRSTRGQQDLSSS